MLLPDERDLGERAGDADEAGQGEAEPGAVEEEPHELRHGEQHVRLHVALHPGHVHLRAQLDEQGEDSADHRSHESEGTR